MAPRDIPVLAQQGLDSRTAASTFLAIMSPCSSCANRRPVEDANGNPACPRMTNIQLQQQAAAAGADFSQYDHLAMTGLEYNPFATPSPGVLANPVYDFGRGSIYIWVARLVDNRGSSDGSIPPITDPTFLANFTGSIQCSLYPAVPDESLASYFTAGRMKEGDQVVVTAYRSQQLADDGSEILLCGTASKVAFHGSFDVQNRPKKDDHPRGS